MSNVNCLVTSDGQVSCVPSARIEALCVADLSRYPFDTQNCTVRIGSWVHSGEEVYLKISTPPVNTDDHLDNGQWEISSVSAYKHAGHYKCCPNNTYPSLNYNFLIKRQSGGHTTTIIIPAIGKYHTYNMFLYFIFGR